MRKTNFIKIKLEAIIGFAGEAYLPTEFQFVHDFIAKGMRGVGLLDKPAGVVPIWVQDGRFGMSLYFPNKNKSVPTEEELKKCQEQFLRERQAEKSSGDGARQKTKASKGRSRPKRKRSKTRTRASARAKKTSG